MYFLYSIIFHIRHFILFIKGKINFYFTTGRSLIFKIKGNIVIKKNVVFRNFCNILVLKNANLYISENCFFNNYCSINCMGDVFIGKNSIFGEGVKIYDHNHIYKTKKIIKEEGYNIKSVKIGDNVWCGSNVVILAGVSIGNNSVIGAGSVVYRDVPSDTLLLANGTMKKIDR